MTEVPQVPEGLSLNEYRMRQAYYARTASRLPIGSKEKRSALEQVRLSEQMIDNLSKQGGAKPGASLPGLLCNGDETLAALQASMLMRSTVPDVLQANVYHQRIPAMFIQLTQLNGTPILINTDSIRHVMAEAERSLLTFNDSAAPGMPVRETYTQVLQTLRDCGAHVG
jgi:hypothetical protein